MQGIKGRFDTLSLRLATFLRVADPAANESTPAGVFAVDARRALNLSSQSRPRLRLAALFS